MKCCASPRRGLEIRNQTHPQSPLAITAPCVKNVIIIWLCTMLKGKVSMEPGTNHHANNVCTNVNEHEENLLLSPISQWCRREQHHILYPVAFSVVYTRIILLLNADCPISTTITLWISSCGSLQSTIILCVMSWVTWLHASQSSVWYQHDMDVLADKIAFS